MLARVTYDGQHSPQLSIEPRPSTGFAPLEDPTRDVTQISRDLLEHIGLHVDHRLEQSREYRRAVRWAVPGDGIPGFLERAQLSIADRDQQVRREDEPNRGRHRLDLLVGRADRHAEIEPPVFRPQAARGFDLIELLA